MPGRSNEFQRLIFLVKQQVAADCTVTESKMLQDRLSNSLREVDICIERSVADHLVTVCIECRDHKRKADVKWVEEMKTKHERLSTNALVLVSRSGFTHEAQTVAAIYNIETLSFEDVTADSVGRLFGELSSIWSKVVFITPTKVVITVAATDQLPAESIVAATDTALYNSDGVECGAVLSLVQFFLNSKDLLNDVLSRGLNEHKYLVTGWRNPRDNQGKALCLLKLEPSILREIELIEVTAECKFDVNEFSLKRGRLGKTAVAWGNGTILGNAALLAASQEETGIRRLSVNPKDPENPDSWSEVEAVFRQVYANSSTSDA